MRGQLVVVANESKGMYSLSGAPDMSKAIGESCYIIDRPAGKSCLRTRYDRERRLNKVPAGGGTAIGGSYHVSWSGEPDMALAERMMHRAIQICPHLVPQGSGIEALQVIRHQVGLRPVREGGPRIEREIISDPDLGWLDVVHCYGAGGFGFQASYGMANSAIELLGERLKVSL